LTDRHALCVAGNAISEERFQPAPIRVGTEAGPGSQGHVHASDVGLSTAEIPRWTRPRWVPERRGTSHALVPQRPRACTPGAALDRPSRTGDGTTSRGVAGAAPQAGSGRSVRGARAHPRPGVAAGGWCSGRRRVRARRRRRTKCGTLPLRPRRLMAGARAAHLFPRLSPGPGGFFLCLALDRESGETGAGPWPPPARV